MGEPSVYQKCKQFYEPKKPEEKKPEEKKPEEKQPEEKKPEEKKPEEKKPGMPADPKCDPYKSDMTVYMMC